MRHSEPHATSVFEPVRRLASASANVGLSLFGAGLLALAAVEAGLLVQGEARAHAAPETARLADASQVGRASALPAPCDEFAESSWTEHTPAAGALGTQEGAPRPPTVIGIAAVPTNNGTILYRLLSTGRIESSAIGSEGTWGAWVNVAPGERGGRAPRSGDE
jgi:hypothetical protein